MTLVESLCARVASGVGRRLQESLNPHDLMKRVQQASGLSGRVTTDYGAPAYELPVKRNGALYLVLKADDTIDWSGPGATGNFHEPDERELVKLCTAVGLKTENSTTGVRIQFERDELVVDLRRGRWTVV